MSGCAPDQAGPSPGGNSAGLDHIAYRVADFAAFRRALLSPLAGEQQLTDWSPAPGDLGLAVLEWWAYLGDILTFYNELIANGSYLRTAAMQPGPQNAAGLARLLGYLPSPAITATGVIAAIRSAGVPDGDLVIPAGLQITSTPTADAPAQLFEADNGTFQGSSDGLVGLPPDPALFQPAAGQDPEDKAAPRTVLLAGHVGVTTGDQFVLVKRGWDGTTPEWAVVTADSAATEKDPDGPVNTRVTLDSADWTGIDSDAPAELAPPAPSGPTALLDLPSSFSSPAPYTPPGPRAGSYQLRRTTATAALWTMPTASGDQPVAAPTATPGSSQTLTVPISTLVRSVQPGDNVLFTGSSGGSPPQTIQFLAQVSGYAEEVTRVQSTTSNTDVAAPNPDVFIPHTNLTIQVAHVGKDVAGLQSALSGTLGGISMHYGFRDVGDLVATPIMAVPSLPVTVYVPAGLKLDGPVAVEDANGTGLMVTTAAASAPGSVTLQSADGGSATLDSPLRPPIRLLANLVHISRGTTVPLEILGDGDPAAASQAFVLQHSPLIYLPPAQPGGDPASTLVVTVDEVPWQQVPAFSGHSAGATVYVVTQLADGTTQVRFGDGIEGARLPLGVGNVTATYRYGPPPPPAGQALPPPPPGRLSTVLQPQPGLATVRNPVDITAGSAPESSGTTAAAAPATVALLRAAASEFPPLITLTDCERLAATVVGVTRVRAYWTWSHHLRRPAITVYVGASDTGTATAVKAVKKLFLDGASRVPLSAAPARSIALTVSCQLLCSQGTNTDDTKTTATNALTAPGGLFSAPGMGIGQRLYRSQIEAALMVPGVVAVFGLRVHRSVQAKPPTAPGTPAAAASTPGESVFDPGQDGYYSLAVEDLTISVVTR